jgi:membrane protease YdiL (CAAX protease family)
MLLYLLFLAAAAAITGQNFVNFLSSFTGELREENIVLLRYMIISQGIALFIVPAIIFFVLMNPAPGFNFMVFRTPGIIEVGLVVVLAFCIFPVTSFTGLLNSSFHLPDFFSGVEQWMHKKEDAAARITDLFMVSDTFGIMLFNVFMIAVIPALGEELIFRGVFQKIFHNLFKSDHLAIWITAILFSAIHFQFFGFVPRLILGLVFGYLYFWSGTLWLPVISHFVNNAVPVAGAYLMGWERLNGTTDIKVWEQIFVLPVPIIIAIAIMCYFRRKGIEKAGIGMNETIT